MTSFVIRNCKLNDTVPELIQQPEVFVELELTHNKLTYHLTQEESCDKLVMNQLVS